MAKKRRKKAKDELFPRPRFVNTSCNLCNRCKLDTYTGKCIYGGPWKHFIDKEGNPIHESI